MRNVTPYYLPVVTFMAELARLFMCNQKNANMKKFILSILTICMAVVLFAQEGESKQIDVNINTEGGAWYASPWVWVLGAAIFILLLVALTRGGSRRAD